MSGFEMNFWSGVWRLVNSAGAAFVIFLCVIAAELALKFLLKKKTEINILSFICQFLWILIIISILKITGIIGGSFGISSPFDSYISFGFLEEGFNAATVLNILLFVPYGFLPVFIFKNIHRHLRNGIILGAAFSVCIEFLQTFIGRFAQLDDVIMNTFGTFAGFALGVWLLSIIKKIGIKRSEKA